MNNKRKVSLMLVFLLCVSMLQPMAAEAKQKITISKKSLSIVVGKTCKLKIKGTKKKVKWSSSNKSVASVSSKGLVKARKEGKATITAKVSGKKYKCKVTVKAKNPGSNTTQAKPTPVDHSFQGVVSYIKKGGKVLDSGMPYISLSSEEGEDTLLTILQYDESNRELECQSIHKISGFTVSSSIKMFENKKEYQVVYTIEADTTKFIFSANMDAATYTRNTALDFELTGGGVEVSDAIKDASLEVINLNIVVVFRCLNQLLREGGFVLADLGFTAY